MELPLTRYVQNNASGLSFQGDEGPLEVIKKRRKRRTVSAENIDSIILAYSEIKRRRKLKRKNKKAIKNDVSEEVAELLCIGRSTVRDVWTYWNEKKVAPPTAIRGNFMNHPSCVNLNHLCIQRVREFIREKHMNREYVRSKDVGEMMMREGLLMKKCTTRTIRKFLHDIGYTLGKMKGHESVKERLAAVRTRNRYLQNIEENRNKGPDAMIEVWTDESYCDQDHRSLFTLIDTNDKYDIIPRGKHRSSRWCIVAAIWTDVEGGGGLLKDSTLIFNPKSVRSDYHGNFKTPLYHKWFTEQLLPELDKLPKKCMIMMDNAAYHKSCPPDSINIAKMKKADTMKFLDEHKIPYEKNDYVAVLRGKLRMWRNENVKPWIVQEAEKRGHTVVYTPPHHCELQPIEMIWAEVKRKVAEQHTEYTTLPDVKERLKAAFDHITSEYVIKVREHVRKSESDDLRIDKVLYDEVSEAPTAEVEEKVEEK